MNDLSSMSPQEIKAAEKQLYEEYKQKVAQLKKVQKEKEAVGQVFTKGLLPIYVLYILSLGPSNGNDISHKIGQRTGGLWIPSTGGIYPLLKKLEKQDLIIGEWDDLDKKFQKLLKSSYQLLFLSFYYLLIFSMAIKRKDILIKSISNKYLDKLF